MGASDCSLLLADRSMADRSMVTVVRADRLPASCDVSGSCLLPGGHWGPSRICMAWLNERHSIWMKKSMALPFMPVLFQIQ